MQRYLSNAAAWLLHVHQYLTLRAIQAVLICLGMQRHSIKAFSSLNAPTVILQHQLPNQQFV